MRVMATSCLALRRTLDVTETGCAAALRGYVGSGAPGRPAAALRQCPETLGRVVQRIGRQQQLLDDLVGTGQECGGKVDTDRPCCRRVEHELELRR